MVCICQHEYVFVLYTVHTHTHTYTYIYRHRQLSDAISSHDRSNCLHTVRCGRIRGTKEREETPIPSAALFSLRFVFLPLVAFPFVCEIILCTAVPQDHPSHISSLTGLEALLCNLCASLRFVALFLREAEGSGVG